MPFALSRSSPLTDVSAGLAALARRGKGQERRANKCTAETKPIELWASDVLHYNTCTAALSPV